VAPPQAIPPHAVLRAPLGCCHPCCPGPGHAGTQQLHARRVCYAERMNRPVGVSRPAPVDRGSDDVT
jgi:hypothetical protein